MDRLALLAELERLEPGTHFARICEIADFFLDAGLFSDAEQAYWRLIPDGFRPGGSEALEFLSPDLWRLYEEGDLHEFTKWSTSIPCSNVMGDRRNLAGLCEDIGYALLGQLRRTEAERMFRIAVALMPTERQYQQSLQNALRDQSRP